jgi:YHS domain-containing protein
VTCRRSTLKQPENPRKHCAVTECSNIEVKAPSSGEHFFFASAKNKDHFPERPLLVDTGFLTLPNWHYCRLFLGGPGSHTS